MTRRMASSILKEKTAERRFYSPNQRIGGFDDSFEDPNTFSNTGFVEEGAFASGIWDMFGNDDGWGQKIQ